MKNPLQSVNFKELGLKVVGRSPRQYSFDDIKGNRLRFLEDYPKMGFKFCVFEDQIFDLVEPEGRSEIFGVCSDGLIVSSVESVYIFLFDPQSFGKDNLYLNRSIQEFSRCFSYFLMAIHELKANNGDLDSIATSVAERLKENLSSVNPNTVGENSYWSHLVYLIDDLVVPLQTTLNDYIANCRFTHPNT